MKIAIMAVLVRTLPAYRPALTLLVCTARLIHSTMAPSLIHQLSTQTRGVLPLARSQARDSL